MADVADGRVKIKLINWESKETPLAPLTSSQRDTVLEISDELCLPTIPDCLPPGNEHDTNSTSSKKESEDTAMESLTRMMKGEMQLDNIQNFLSWYSQLEFELEKTNDILFTDNCEVLMDGRRKCISLLAEIDGALNSLVTLSDQYQVVATKTNSLHQVSEELLEHQTRLNRIYEKVGNHLQYFTAVDRLSSQINSPTLVVTSEAFVDILDRLDACMEYLTKNNKWQEAPTYLLKYRHCLSRALVMVNSYVVETLEHATQQACAPSTDQSTAAGDTVFALCYGKFQASAPKVKPLLGQIEARVHKCAEYEQLLASCHQTFFAQRDLLMSLSVRNAMTELTETAALKRDHCSLVRSGCAFLVHICHDEYQLFYQFFQQPTPQCAAYLEGLCTTLYDVLRPFIIHINHLETLAEVCSILRLEMLEEHVQNNPGPLEAFGRIAWQLLHDVQERLVYRAHCYLQSDVLQYQPSAGDLAYPEKLEMMESIAQSLQEQNMQSLRRSESRSSIASVGSATSQEVARINSDNTVDQPRSRTGNSPADLHGMWYPTVRRVLVCLSRLYRCVDRPIFQGLSQEALTMCIQSVASAAQQISSKKTTVDGELFQIKHLLILREQIAPFQVDFTVKELSLDFSKVKTAAFGLLHKRKRLFSFGTNNALLEFLLEGTPQVKEQLVDSRKEVDRQLKGSCEAFITHVTKSIAGGILDFNKRVEEFKPEEPNTTLSQQPFATPEIVANIVQEAQRFIKTKLPLIQRSMQLYLANRETEFILFRPIKNNIVASFGQLHTILSTGGYSSDNLLLIGCPTQEHASVLISSQSLLTAAMDQHRVNATSPVLEEGVNNV